MSFACWRSILEEMAIHLARFPYDVLPANNGLVVAQSGLPLRTFW
jgi:hypothetical protein